MTNLSEGEMAVRTVQALRHSSIIDFAFDLSSGAGVSLTSAPVGANCFVCKELSFHSVTMLRLHAKS